MATFWEKAKKINEEKKNTTTKKVDTNTSNIARNTTQADYQKMQTNKQVDNPINAGGVTRTIGKETYNKKVDENKVYVEQKKNREQEAKDYVNTTLKKNFDNQISKEGFDWRDIYDDNGKSVDYESALANVNKQIADITNNNPDTEQWYTNGVAESLANLNSQKSVLEEKQKVQKDVLDYAYGQYILSDEASKEEKDAYYESASFAPNENDDWREKTNKFVGRQASAIGSFLAETANIIPKTIDVVQSYALNDYADKLEASANQEGIAGTAVSQELLDKAKEIRAQRLANNSDTITRALDDVASQLNQNAYLGAGEVEKIMSQAGVSTAQFLTHFALFGPAGSLASMSIASGSDRAYELMNATDEYGNRLYTDDQAIANGLLTGVVSYLTERIGMDNFVNIVSGGAGTFAIGSELSYILKSVGTQGVSEGLEEIAEGLVNPIVDVVTGVSDHYEVDGTELLLSFVTAGISGGFTGGVGAFNYSIETKAQYNLINAQRTKALQIMQRNDVSQEDKQICQDFIDYASQAMGVYEGKTTTGMAVDLPSDVVQETTLDEDINMMENTVNPNVNEELKTIQSLQDSYRIVNEETQKFLDSQGKNLIADEYIDMTQEERTKFDEDSRIISEAYPNTNILYTTNAIDPETGESVNAYVTGDGQIVVNPKGDTPAVVSALHEIVHTIENTGEWFDIFNEVFKNPGSALSKMNELASGRYKGADIATQKSEALAVALTEDVMNEQDAQKVIEHLAKYNTSFAYKMLYKFEQATGLFKDNSTIGKVTSLLTSALDRQDEVYMNDGTHFSKKANPQKRISDFLDYVGKTGDADFSEDIPLTKVVTKVVDGKRVMYVTRPKWAVDLGLPTMPYLVKASAIANTQYDAKNPIATKNFKSSRHTNDDIKNPKNPIDRNIVENIDVLFNNPIAVFEGSKKGTYMLVLRATDTGGFPIIMSVSESLPTGSGDYQRASFVDYSDVKHNRVRSVMGTGLYGKNSFKRIGDFLKDLNMLWSDGGITKSQVISHSNTLQWRASGKTLADNIVAPYLEKANKLKVIQNANAKEIDGRMGVNTRDDILTYEEATADPGELMTADDYTEEDIEKARRTGEILVYSSTPIQNGAFVTPSRMEAMSYVGDGPLYSAIVSTNNVAWIDSLEGQYANEENRGLSPIDNAKMYAYSDDVAKQYGSKIDEILKNIKTDEDYVFFEKTNKDAIDRKSKWDNSQKQTSRVLSKLLGYGLETLDLKKSYAGRNVIINPDAKSINSAVTKVMSKKGKVDDYGNLYSLDSIKDQNRWTVQVANVNDIPIAINKLFAKYPNGRLEIKNDNELFVIDSNKDLSFELSNLENYGYIGFHFTWEENGIKKEIQVSPDFNTKIKSDSVYEKWRRFSYNDMTDAQKADYAKDVEESHKLWNSFGEGKIPSVIFNILSSETGRDSSYLRSLGSTTLTQFLDAESNSPINQPLSVNNNVGVSESITMDNPLGMSNINVPPYTDSIAQEVQENRTKFSRRNANEENDDLGNKKIQQFAESNIPKSAVFTEAQKEKVRQEIANGGYTYVGLSNKAEIANAEERYKAKGKEKAYADFMNNASPTATTVIDGEILVSKLAQENDPRWEDVSIKLADDSTIIGQALQAYSIMQRLTPNGQLRAIERNLNKMQQDIDNKFGERRAPRLRINEQMKERLLTAKDVEELENAREAIYKDLTDQVPKTIGDVLDSWRYLAMLGNPRTHIRNFVGNGIFVPFVDMKNSIGAVLEGTLGKALGVEYRTKALGFGVASNLFASESDKALIREGEKQYDIYKGAIENDQKYERKGFTERTVVGKTLNKLSDFNSKALDQSDFLFSRDRFARSYAQFMKANNLTVENMTDDMKKRASNYALIEAQKATYRDANALAEWLNKLEYSNKKGLKLASFAKKAVIPFTKTPMNIVKRGVEYSPVGLIKTLSYGINELNSGRINANEFIDQLASGLTGTALTALGWFLSRAGIFRTKDDDKDRKQYFDEDNGEQDYSIVTDKGSYTIDWATPVIMPMSMGANLGSFFDTLDGVDGFSSGLNAVLDITARIADPVVETTMLSGLKDTLTSFANSDGQWFGDMVMSAMSSYVNQMFPTIGGQLARTIDDTRRTTYPNDGGFDKTFKQILNKIPGLSKYNQPYINREGKEQKNYGNAFTRAMLNFFSPGYYAEKTIDKYDEEMYRLLETTGDDNAIPSSSSKSVTFDKENIKFTDKEYTEWHKTRWANESKYVNNFIDSAEYKSLSDDERIGVISDIRSYAQLLAKKQILDSRGFDKESDSYKDLMKKINKISGAESHGIAIYKYFDYENNAGDKQAEKIDYLKKSGLTDAQQEYLYDTENYKTSFKDAYEKAMKKNVKKNSSKSSNKKTSNSSSSKKISLGTANLTSSLNLSNNSSSDSNSFKKAYSNVFRNGTSTAKSTDNGVVSCPNCGNDVKPTNGVCPVCGNDL